MVKRSAGILLHRTRGGSTEVLLVHPGGPFWRNKDLGAWSIPKGEHGEDEQPQAAALREFAEALRGAVLTVRSDQLEPTDDPDEFHDLELEGLRVVQVSGAEVGVVREVVHTPGGELLAVRTSDDREVLVPFVSAIVPEVDLAAGRLVVDPPEGLLDAG